LRAGMPESVVLDKIHAITGKFDTSASALITLKQAGATEAELKAVMAQGTMPTEQPSANTPTTSGPTLAESLKFIQDKVNQQGNIAYTETMTMSSGENYRTVFQSSLQSQIIAIDPAGGLSVQDMTTATLTGMFGSTSSGTTTWQVNFRDIDKLDVMSSADYKNSTAPTLVFQDSPQYYELLIHLTPGKTVRVHTEISTCAKGAVSRKQSCKPTATDNNSGVVSLHFRDEDTANRVAKAMIHAIELSGGGNNAPEPF